MFIYFTLLYICIYIYSDLFLNKSTIDDTNDVSYRLVSFCAPESDLKLTFV